MVRVSTLADALKTIVNAEKLGNLSLQILKKTMAKLITNKEINFCYNNFPNFTELFNDIIFRNTYI